MTAPRRTFENERGFVLPLLLILLVVATIAGGSVAAVAVQQADYAGRLNSSVRAIQAAESGAAFVVNGFLSDQLSWVEDGEYAGAALEQVGEGLPSGPGLDLNHADARWWVDAVDFEGNGVLIRIVGEDASGRVRRELEVEFSRGGRSTASPFQSAVVGCNGVVLRGSGRIDSYDSRDGPYLSGQASSDARVTTLSGDVSLPGNTLVKGDLHVGGNLTMSGSATVEGSMMATGDITFSGNPTCPANPVLAGGAVQTPGTWWCPGAELEPGADVPAPHGTCDPLNVNDFVDGTLEGARPGGPGDFENGNYSGWRPSPVNFEEDVAFSPSFSSGATNQINFASDGVGEVFVNGNFSMGGSSIVRIQAPSTPGEGVPVRLFVDGDMTLGGGSQLIIEPGAALEVYVTGRVNLGGGLVNQNAAPTMTIVEGGSPVIIPTFSIFSSFAGHDGVRIGGSTQIYASVYAPRTDVSVIGSGGLYGAVRGSSVDVTGAGGIHYDEALGEGRTGVVTEGGSARVTRWREVL